MEIQPGLYFHQVRGGGGGGGGGVTLLFSTKVS